jgi:hypothetical protein
VAYRLTYGVCSNRAFADSRAPPGPRMPPTRRLEVFPLAVVAQATGGWDKTQVLGRGGFGQVYFGELPDGRKIAVKRLRLADAQQKGSNQVRTAQRVRDASCDHFGAAQPCA